MPEPLPQFIANHQTEWQHVESLVDTARGRVGRLDQSQVRALGHGYRRVVADLALARHRFPGDPVVARLEHLARRARPLLYSGVGDRRSVLEFVTTGYWRRVREQPRVLLIATVLLFGPALLMGVWSNTSPAEAKRVAQVSDLSAGIGEGNVRDPDTDRITDPETAAAFSAQIFTNNVRVAFVAFAGGLTGGVLTGLSLLFNGAVLGLVAGLAIHGGNGESLWRLVAPHGVLELSLIVVAGAAGFRLGWALLRPGHRTRAEAMAVEGRAAVEMALGSAVLLVPTGLVEGFVTPRGLSLPAALAVGLALGAVFWALVIWRGRPDQSRAALFNRR